MKIDVTEFINALAEAIVKRMTEKVAPETPAPKKRGRPKKTEAEEKPARRRGRPPKEAKEEEEITPEHVQGLLQQYSGVFGRQNVVDLLKAHGAKSLPDLDEKEYAAICAAAQKELDRANTDIDLGI